MTNDAKTMIHRGGECARRDWVVGGESAVLVGSAIDLADANAAAGECLQLTLGKRFAYTEGSSKGVL
jgi:hypothetical protein